MVRDNRIDSLKGFLIVLVVLGHIIICLDNVNTINHAVMGLIYVFHMPLFILLSGYLTKPADQQVGSKLWKNAAVLLVTIVIFHLLSVTRQVLMNGQDLTKTLLQFPYGILWYLMSLIYWRFMLYYTPQPLLRRPLVYLSLAFVVSALSGLTQLGNLLSIQRALNFFPFFLLGYYYRQGAINQRWWKGNIVHIVVVVVLLPLIFWLYPHCGKVLNGADHYPVTELPQKALILICSVAMTLLVFNLARDVKWLRPIGKDSLFYYLYHYYIIIMLIEPLVQYYVLPRNLPFVLLYTAIVMGLLVMLHKIKFLRWLTRPPLPRHSRRQEQPQE